MQQLQIVLACLLVASCHAFAFNTLKTSLHTRSTQHDNAMHRVTVLRMTENPSGDTESTAVAEDASDEPMDEATRIMREKMKKVEALKAQEVFIKRSTGKHKCLTCDWEYDEAKGDSYMIGGLIQPNTPFADVPSNWRCPTCRASKDNFQEITEEIPGFEVNQGYGFGGNSLTGGQKNTLIFGGLFFFFVLFIGGYGLS